MRLPAVACWLVLTAAPAGAYPLPAPKIDPAHRLDVALACDFKEIPAAVTVPVRVSLRNEAPRPRELRLVFETSPVYGRQFGSCRSTHLLHVEAGTSGERELIVPLCHLPAAGSVRLDAHLEGDVSAARFSLASRHVGGRGPGTVPSAGVAFSHEVAATGAVEVVRAQLDGDKVTLLDSRFEIASVPSDWRGWAAFSAVVMTHAEWDALVGAPRDALLDWVAAGGHLVRLGGGEDRRPHGLGAIADTPEPAPPPELVAALVRSLPPAPLADLPEHDASPLVGAVGRTTAPRPSLALLMVLYALAVGPVNLWMFRGARRIHVFWTTPLVASLACAALAAAILANDGVGGRGVRLAAVVLMPDEHREVIVQEQVVRSGLLLRSSFEADERLLLAAAPLGRTDRAHFERAGRRFSGDWFRSRAVHAHLAMAVRPSRARLRVGGGPDSPTLVSTWPATLAEVVVVDGRGRRLRATGVRPGEAAALQPAEDDADPIAGARARAGPRLRDLLGRVRGRTGWFTARAAPVPGLPVDAGPDVRWQDEDVILMGPLQ